jgi:hypothetical protein
MSDPMENGQNDPEDIEYGLRRSRRSTSYEYRDSSTLTPAQIMEQEVYYESAEITTNLALQTMHIVCTLLPLFHRYNAILLVLQFSQPAEYMISSLKASLIRIKETIEKLILLIKWTISYGEIALLYAEDLSVFIRRRNRFRPKRFRRLDDINRRDCYSWFGHSPSDLRRLFIAWRIPTNFRTPSNNVFNGEECFIIYLFHLMKGTPFTEMARHVFGGDPRYMSSMFDLVINHLYFMFYNKISGTSLDQWLPRYLTRCRSLIHNALADGAIFETEYLNGKIVNQNCRDG